MNEGKYASNKEEGIIEYLKEGNGKRMRKKVRQLALPIAFILLAQTAFPASSMAMEQKAISPNYGISGDVPQAVNTSQPVKIEISLEKAITIVKQNFEVPGEFTEFTSGYNSYNTRQTWSLNWRAPGETGGNFMAQVDVSNGEIINVSSWKPVKSGSGLYVSNFSYNQAKEIAEKLVNKILSDRINQLEIVPENTRVIPITDYGPVTYSVQWKRVVDGVSFPSNGVTVQVNGNDGTISGYTLNWSKESFPSTQGVIGEVKAREVFENNKLLELQYFVSPIIRPLATSASSKGKVQLIYQLSNSSFNGIIDAKTGEPLRLNSGEWLSSEEMADAVGGYGGAASKDAAAQPLTPEEQKEIEKSAQLITQEQAIEAIKKWVEIPEGLTLRNVNLGAEGGFNQNRVWSFDWNSDQASKEGYHYIYGRVDAVTGEVLGFNTDSPYQGAEKPQTIDRTSAKELAEEFLKKIQPGRFQEVKLLDTLEMGRNYPEDQVRQEFQYQRIVNGVTFPGNGVSVTVNTVTKKVIGFNMNWWTLDFPAVSEAMGQNQAHDTFLAARPLTLKYVQLYKNGQPGEIRLVYQPKIENSLTVSNRIDAKTGQFLDWQGSPLSELPRPYTFKDISGNFAEKEISLLGQAGVFGEYGDQFKPEENITVVAMLRGMLMVKNGVWMNQPLKDYEVLKQAREQGWLKEELGANDGINRELLTKLVIRMLQLEKIAQMEGLFQAPYEDSSSFSSGSLGYVALAKGLGVMKIDGTKFEPTHTVTRAEAAYAIVKALGANR